jgi:hypothetical protein
MRIFGGLVALVVIVFGAIYFVTMEFTTVHNVTFKVASKDDQSTSKGHQYLIFTGRNHTLVDKDSIWHGKNDSSLVWTQLRTGETVTCPVYGYRRFFPTSYMDILDGCKQVPAGTPTTY